MTDSGVRFTTNVRKDHSIVIPKVFFDNKLVSESDLIEVSIVLKNADKEVG